MEEHLDQKTHYFYDMCSLQNWPTDSVQSQSKSQKAFKKKKKKKRNWQAGTKIKENGKDKKQSKQFCKSESEVTQLCLNLCDSMNNTVHGILQDRTLEWIACPFSRGSS